jgi:hemoglobin
MSRKRKECIPVLLVQAITVGVLSEQRQLTKFINKERYMSSLYEKIGGEPAVNAAVDIFYRKVLKDDRIKHFFDGVDMEKQAAKQKAFLTMAFGGPHNYTGEDMRKGHAHLVKQGLNDSHFDAVMENLGATLTELKVPGDLIAQAAAIAESTRNDVLGK